MDALYYGEDIRQACDTLKLSYAELASQIGVSNSTLARHAKSSILDITISLAIECLLRRRAASYQTPVSPAERAKRKFEEQKILAELRAADKGLHEAKARAQVETTQARRRFRAENPDLTDIALLERAQLSRAGKSIRGQLERAQRKAIERRLIAELHVRLKALGFGSNLYHVEISTARLAAENQKQYFVANYLNHMDIEILADDDILVTLPEE